MGFDVKNTTKWRPIDLLCPHTCRGCGRLGAVLCECCKNYILKQREALEIEAEDLDFAVGRREGLLEAVVKEYKYGPVRASGVVLAELLAAVIPRDLAGPVIVVPLPTIAKHIRERGFDHMVLMARKLAKTRKFGWAKLLTRENSAVQVGASEEERLEQAKTAYGLKKGAKLDPETTYLLVDDVWTTGASLRAAREVLRAAGATKIRTAAVAVSPTSLQPLQKRREC